MSTSSHSEPRSFNTSESLEGEASGRKRAVEEGEEESRDLAGGKSNISGKEAGKHG